LIPNIATSVVLAHCFVKKKVRARARVWHQVCNFCWGQVYLNFKGKASGTQAQVALWSNASIDLFKEMSGFCGVWTHGTHLSLATAPSDSCVSTYFQ
jgi:hypothetical protein